MLTALPIIEPNFAPKPNGDGLTTLKLSRLPGQSIVIDGPATVTTRQRGHRTLLAITAPPSTRIMRSELLGR